MHGYLMILAEGTTHIAAHTANGQNLCSRIKVTKRLFFNRIQCYGGYFSIGGGYRLSFFQRSDTAESRLSLLQLTGMRTQITYGLHDAVRLQTAPA